MDETRTPGPLRTQLILSDCFRRDHVECWRDFTSDIPCRCEVAIRPERLNSCLPILVCCPCRFRTSLKRCVNDEQNSSTSLLRGRTTLHIFAEDQLTLFRARTDPEFGTLLQGARPSDLRCQPSTAFAGFITRTSLTVKDFGPLKTSNVLSGTILSARMSRLIPLTDMD